MHQNKRQTKQKKKKNVYIMSNVRQLYLSIKKLNKNSLKMKQQNRYEHRKTKFLNRNQFLFWERLIFE